MKCTPTFTTVTCTFSTSRPVKAAVATGTTKKVLIPTTEGRKHTNHTITVRGLEPDTKYLAQLTAVGVGGKPVWASFSTLGPGDGPAAVTWQKASHWLFNGSRFAPMLAVPWDLDSNGCPSQRGISQALAIGSRMLDMVGGQCGPDTSEQISNMHQLLSGRMWWNNDPFYAADGPMYAPIVPDWTKPGEAELIAWSQPSRRLDAGCSSQTRSSFNPGIFVCSQSTGGLYSILHGHAPQASTISITKRSFLDGAKQTPQRIANEFWLSVVAGGWTDLTTQGIGSGSPPPTPAMLKVAREDGRLLAAVAPILTYGGPVAVKQSWKVPAWTKAVGNKWKVRWVRAAWPPIRLFGWHYGGRTYVLAVNDGIPPGRVATRWNVHLPTGQWQHYSYDPNVATATLSGVKGSVTPLWGAKGLTLEGAKATIRLPKLGVGWYEITPR